MLFIKKIKLIIFLCLVSNWAIAASPITITHTNSLNFGKVVKPTSGSVIVRVNRAGNIAGATTAIVLDSSNVSFGRDVIKGSGGGNDIRISFAECASNSALNLELKRFRAKYGNEPVFTNVSNVLPAPGNGTTLQYGATLQIFSNVTTGLKTPCYNLEVIYD